MTKRTRRKLLQDKELEELAERLEAIEEHQEQQQTHSRA